jgi:hypothetical protein
MKRLWPLLTIAVPLQLIHAQEVKHAPTVEQCRADQRLWLSKMAEPNGKGTADVSYKEVKGWVGEMVYCSKKVDPAFGFEYLNAQSEAEATSALRLENFLFRHNLLRQFLAEDAQGKR